MAATILTIVASNAHATVFGGVDFPQGASSFADQIVSFTVGDPAPQTPYQGTFNALGPPNYAGVSTCSSQTSCPFVSLGSGGTLVVRFTDNRLTGSGSTADDLYIFEVGPDVESTFVWLSNDDRNWYSVGEIQGSTRGIDIDAYGFGLSASFSYVKLMDDPNQGSRDPNDPSVGADIDAVGAISSVFAAPVPEPASWALLLTGFGLAGVAIRRRAPGKACPTP